MHCLEADVTVVGSGIAGLWSANELLDQGYSVQVVEREKALAAGATTRNQGWLHAGTYHAAGIENSTDALNIAQWTRTGAEAIAAYAPESIGEERSFALVRDEDLVCKALQRWGATNIAYRSIPRSDLRESQVLDVSSIAGIFEVQDRSVNSRVVCTKLARDIIKKGGRIITDATFVPHDDTTAELNIGKTKQNLLVKTACFVITAGGGIEPIITKLTSSAPKMRFFKAHLLIYPRLADNNYFFLDVGEVGIINHGDASVVGINRDGIEQLVPDRDIVLAKVDLIRSALGRLMPRTLEGSGQFLSVACTKPDVFVKPSDVQDLGVKVFEPIQNYICALPGKMTEGPYLAQRVVGLVNARNIPRNGIRAVSLGRSEYEVQLRPADEWMASNHVRIELKNQPLYKTR